VPKSFCSEQIISNGLEVCNNAPIGFSKFRWELTVYSTNVLEVLPSVFQRRATTPWKFPTPNRAPLKNKRCHVGGHRAINRQPRWGFLISMNWFKALWKGLTTPVSREGAGSPEPLHNFTPKAQQVLTLARTEAERLHHNFVGTEHLLLGLIALDRGTAVTVLKRMGLKPETVRAEVEKCVGTGPEQRPAGSIPYTPRVKKVLALAIKQAKALSHTYVGTEHILLGLLHEGDGVAARVLLNLGVRIDETRTAILEELNPNLKQTIVDVVRAEESAKRRDDMIDLSKRYDVYCKEGSEAMVYRNVLFKGMKKLFQVERYSIFTEYVEVEQADGKTIFFSRASIIKFCEHGIAPGSESVEGKKE
jgi:hypothetical protein